MLDRFMMKSSGFSKTDGSRLAAAYVMVMGTPGEMVLPCMVVSCATVLAKPRYGLYSLMNSSTAAGMSDGSSRSWSCSARSCDRWLQMDPNKMGGATIPTTRAWRMQPRRWASSSGLPSTLSARSEEAGSSSTSRGLALRSCKSCPAMSYSLALCAVTSSPFWSLQAMTHWMISSQ